MSGRFQRIDRRDYLRTIGAVGLATVAGCSSGGGGNNQSDGGNQSGGGNQSDGGGGTTGTTKSASKVVLGQPPISGSDIGQIQPPVNSSVAIARAEVNEAGGPLGSEVEIVRRDTERNPDKAPGVVKKLINEDGAVAINRLTSTDAVPNFEFLKKQQVPVVTMFAGARFFDSRGGDNGTPGNLSDDGWFWRTTGADSQHTAAAALFAKDQGAKKVGLLNSTAAGATEWADAFADGVKAVDGVELAVRKELDPEKQDYSSSVDALFKTDIDAFGLATSGDRAINAIKHWNSQDYGGSVLLSNPLKNAKIANNLGGVVDPSSVFVSVPAVAGPNADSFVSKFNEQNPDKSINNWSAAGYDAINVTALAVHAAGKADPKAVEKNLGPVSRPPGKKVDSFAQGKKALDNGENINYQGAQTRVNFGNKGDVINVAEIFTLGSDGFKSTTTISAERIRETVKKVCEQTDAC